MKTGIHPDYKETRVHCSCGNEFTTRSTVSEVSAELCSECHPFFTGKQKLVDTGGRVERFQKRAAKASPTKASPTKASPTKASPTSEAEPVADAPEA